MIVEHMVWLKFRDDLPPERIERTMNLLRELTDHVPGIVRLYAGKNFTDRARGFTHGLLVTLESREALETYRTHPEHVKVVQILKEDTSDIMAMDFEHE